MNCGGHVGRVRYAVSRSRSLAPGSYDRQGMTLRKATKDDKETLKSSGKAGIPIKPRNTHTYQKQILIRNHYREVSESP